jgi:hypothetical protein
MPCSYSNEETGKKNDWNAYHKGRQRPRPRLVVKEKFPDYHKMALCGYQLMDTVGMLGWERPGKVMCM